ncbi:MAG TPA: GGDEF domain-containing protein [Verrucomicrobiae bacterium]|nr:GGDEF domain-containing protein [Verrucomicrobiae bacterium]
MKDDIRYSELLFLRDLEKNPLTYFNPNNPNQTENLGLNQITCIEMLIALLEELYIQSNQDDLQMLVWQLRGEGREEKAAKNYPHLMRGAGWPRLEIFNAFLSNRAFQFRITYRGLRRIEELRDLLKRDRILEHFGVLLDIRYFHRDLTDALSRPADVPVSVIRLDLDGFKNVNDSCGHHAGDVVLKSYLEVVRNCLGSLGDGYRAGGDEVAALLIGQDKDRTKQIAENMRACVKNMHCTFKGKILPAVTASIGVATGPPDLRDLDLADTADKRQVRAKKEGKDQVISE